MNRFRKFILSVFLGFVVFNESMYAQSNSSVEVPVSIATLPNVLLDTQWRLVAFESMDDAQGVKHPDDASKYTMQLNKDGTVFLKLNCNSARGTWSAEASEDVQSGSFSFGPLATTLAMCPPPSMDGFIASQAQYVRSYLLKEGRLFLSLMADGGIFVWEPLLLTTSKTEVSLRAGMGKFDASGTIPCAQHRGQPMGQCTFGVARGSHGTATLIVTHSDGYKRTLFFENGMAVGADLSQADGMVKFSSIKEADLFMIRVGTERYEIPEAAPFGG